MKKTLSIVLAAIMIFTLSISAFAAETNGSITVKNVVEGQTYKIYEIFSLESYDTNTGAFSYKTTSDWDAFAKSATQYVTVDKDGYVTWVKGADAAAFAQLALAYAKENSITPTQQTSSAVAKGQTEVTFSNLELGYYLIDSSLGALCILNTTKPNAEVTEKNDKPVPDKTVEEDSTNKYGKKNDADMFQTINYRGTITVQNGAENYVLHDKMSEGLTFGEIKKVSIGDVAVDASKYTISYNTEDGCTFEIAFDNAYIASLDAGTKIVVDYTASLNEEAVIAGEGNDNDMWLDYGDDNESVHDKTKTYTYEFDLIKTDSENKLLDGAEFKLYDAKTGGNEIKVVYDSTKDIYRLAKESEEGVSIVVKEGKATIVGLDGGTTYYLEETVAPKGYNKLNGRVEVQIEDTNISAQFENESNDYIVGTGVQVVNKTGSELPSTGGIGTTLFTFFGAILVLGAGILLVTKKRVCA